MTATHRFEALRFFAPVFRKQVEQNQVTVSNKQLQKLRKLNPRYEGKIKSEADIQTLITNFKL